MRNCAEKYFVLFFPSKKNCDILAIFKKCIITLWSICAKEGFCVSNFWIGVSQETQLSPGEMSMDQHSVVNPALLLRCTFSRTECDPQRERNIA